MNNIVNYADVMAFHPGYYIAEIIEEMGVTQAEFATRLGTTAKNLSTLINGQNNLSKDIARKLASMLGMSVEFWLNLQSAYEEKLAEIEHLKELDEQETTMAMIDYSYFVRVAGLPTAKTAREKIQNLCKYFVISDLRILRSPDFLASFRSGITSSSEKNAVNARAWLQTALNFSKHITTAPFNAEMLKAALPQIRGMTKQNPATFLPKLRQTFAECGVAFVLLPHLKNSGINGAVKWVTPEHAVLAMNDRRLYADTFWFSLFHEIKHVLQQKTKTVFLSSDVEQAKEINAKLETEADSFAQNYLIPQKEYESFSAEHITETRITEFANEIGIHPGIVVGRLQHDGIIAQNRYAALREKYKITP